MLQDLLFGFRNLTQRPGFTAVVVLTLALGIGVNAAIFSVFHAVLLRPLPYEDPDDLVLVWERNLERGLSYMFASPPNFADWREQNQVFDGVAAFRRRGAFLSRDGEPVRVQAAEVSASLFAVLGVDPQAGRGFTAEEDLADGPPAAVIAHTLWQRSFGGDPDVLGRTLEIDGESRTLVGIMPPGFDFPPAIDLEGTPSAERTELWTPLALDPEAGQRGAHYLTVIARLKPGVSLRRADADMAAVAQRLETEYPSTNGGWSITLVPLYEQLFGPSRPTLLVLVGAVGLVLLIVCLNVANLLLARGAARRKELAIRAALGADRMRLVRQLLTESVALAVLGGTAGLLLARSTLALLVELAPTTVHRLDETAVDSVVVGFTFALSLLVGLVFGLAPAWQGTSLELLPWLKEKGAGAGTWGRRVDLRQALVVVEVALALVLLVGSGLLLRSFLTLRGVDPGFRPANVLTVGVTLPEGRYPERRSWPATFEQIERRVAALPEVEAAGLTLDLPLDADRQGTVILYEDEVELDRETRRQVNFTFVTPGYLEAMTVPLLRGRYFGAEDHADGPPVILINEALARRYFADDDPIGKRLKVGFSLSTPRQIVGVVGDVRHDKLARGGFPGVYAPFAQVPWRNRLSLAVRTTAPPLAVLPAVREQVRAVDPGIPLYDVRSLGQILARAMAPQRFAATLLAGFAALALLLAAIGIYGVIAHSVTERTREIGVRVALGARAADVVKMVLGRGMALTGVGVVLGFLGALGLTRFVSSLLFEVSARDPKIFAAVAAGLAAVALVACYLPARRAAAVDPTVALRDE